MVYALQKFRHYVLNNKFTFYVNHMVLLDLVNKPQVFHRLTRWFLLFLDYYFKIVYKPGRSWRAPKSLGRLKLSLNIETTERLKIRGTLPSSQHFRGVEGCAGALEWD
jgi:hypothetical protein